jgi:hypothetical protein
MVLEKTRKSSRLPLDHKSSEDTSASKMLQFNPNVVTSLTVVCGTFSATSHPSSRGTLKKAKGFGENEARCYEWNDSAGNCFKNLRLADDNKTLSNEKCTFRISDEGRKLTRGKVEWAISEKIEEDDSPKKPVPPETGKSSETRKGVQASRRLYREGMNQIFERERLGNLLSAECSFQPKTKMNTNCMESDEEKRTPQQAANRLYNEAAKREMRQSKRRERAIEYSDRNCTFQPILLAESASKINFERDAVFSLPVDKRLYRRAGERNDRFLTKQRIYKEKQKHEFDFMPNSPQRRDFSRMKLSMKQLKETFNCLDTDNSGFLEAKEVQKYFMVGGSMPRNNNDAKLEKKNENETLNSSWSQFTKHIQPKAFISNFRKISKQYEGKIPLSEFQVLFYEASVGAKLRKRKKDRRPAEVACNELYEKAKSKAKNRDQNHFYALKKSLRDEVDGATFRPRTNVKGILPTKPFGKKNESILPCLPSPKESELLRRAAEEAATRLYEQSIAQSEKKRRLIEKAKNELPSECTFQPKLTPRGKRSSGTTIPIGVVIPGVRRVSGKKTKGNNIHFEALYQQGVISYNEQQKMYENEGSGLRDCTFSPRVNKGTKRSSKQPLGKQKPGKGNKANRFDRLYKNGQKSLAIRDKVHNSPAGTFKPKTNHSNAPTHFHCSTQLTTTWGRYDDLSKANSKGSLSRKAVKKTVDKKRIESLYKSGMKQIRQRDIRHREKGERLSQDCTFVPLVNNASPVRNDLVRQFREQAMPTLTESQLKVKEIREVEEKKVDIVTRENAAQTILSFASWNAMATRIQKVQRGISRRKSEYFYGKRRAVIIMQRSARGFMARRRVKKVRRRKKRRTAAAIKIQARERGRQGRRRVRKKRKAIMAAKESKRVKGVPVESGLAIASIARIYGYKAKHIHDVHDSLPKYLRHLYMPTEFGVDAAQQLANLEESVKAHYEEHSRIKWFGTLTGWLNMEIHEDLITAFHPDACNVLLRCIMQIMPANKIEKKLSQPQCLISLKKASDLLHHVLEDIEGDHHHKKTIAHICKDLKQHVVESGSPNKSGKKSKMVDIDLVIAQALRFWYRHVADFDDDGVPIVKLEDEGDGANKKDGAEESKKKHDETATKIQARIRGHQARRKTEKKKEIAQKATKIQAHIRGKQARKKQKEQLDMTKKATKIQAHIRGKQARKKTKELNDQTKAAKKIQAVSRGRKIRKSLKEGEPAAKKPPPPPPGKTRKKAPSRPTKGKKKPPPRKPKKSKKGSI